MGSNFSYYSKFQQFKKAKRVENSVVLYFRRKGCIIFKPNKEDEFNDIDLYVDGEPYSVKNQQAVLKTGNLAFEEYDNGRMSWFLVGKSKFYAICWGNKIYIFEVSLLKARLRALEAIGKTKRKRLTRRQNRTNRKFRNTIFLLVKKEDVLDLAKEIIYI